MSVGGVGRNIAENLARLGVKTALSLAFVGNDANGRLVREACASAGVDLSLIDHWTGARRAPISRCSMTGVN